MAYAFNDDKTKAPFIVIEGSKTVIANGSSAFVIDLNNYGVTNADDYAIVSAMSHTDLSTNWYWTTSIIDDQTGLTNATLTPNTNKIGATLKNTQNTPTLIYYRIVLIKVK